MKETHAIPSVMEPAQSSYGCI